MRTPVTHLAKAGWERACGTLDFSGPQKIRDKLTKNPDKVTCTWCLRTRLYRKLKK